MFFTEATFIGIDPTAGERPFVYAAIDHELGLLALGEGNIDDVLAFCAGQRQALAAVCAPRRPNQGVMQRDALRESLNPAPSPGRWTNFRQAEYQLRQHNIHIPQTPAREEDCPRWMCMGFALFERLSELGYQEYPQDGADRQSLEVYPHACYAALLGVLPFKKHTLEGRLQRQLTLYEQRLGVPDPMRIFEEFTRFRLMKGILSLDNLYSVGELDALVAAYTAWMAAIHPESVLLLGDTEEGQLVLPVDHLKEHYSQGG
jgi:hypothetical protein